jgi:4-hydroxy-2-oxoglutarate aldolase
VTPRPGGVLGPVTTPFTPDGELDLPAFEANLRQLVAAGLDGAVVCGSTGEAALLEEEERRALVASARRALPDDAQLVVGTGAESTRQCIRRCRDAGERGAHAALVVSPHYYGSAMTPIALEAHFRRVADASPIPVLLYNIPKYAHLVLEPDLVARLSTHGNIAGMKDSAGDLARLRGYVQSQGDAFTVFTGHGGSFAQALAIGVRGGILAVALFAPTLSLLVFEQASRGDLSDAALTQELLTPLALEIVGRMGVPGVKAAMDRVGLTGGAPRSPLEPLPEEDVRQVAALLDAARVGAAA